MGLFKFQNYSALKNAQDNPRVQATNETVNGNIFAVGDNVDIGGGVIVPEAQVIFANAAAAQDEVWVAMNIVDQPETRNYDDYSILDGERIRAFNLNKMVGEIVELSGDLVIADAVDPIVVGTALVPTNATDDAGTPMVWKSIVDPVGYSVYLEVTSVTTFGTFTIVNAGVGYECKIKTA